MTASNSERERIKEKLPHELLRLLYLNSRMSVKQLSKELDISYHTVSKYLKLCEEKYSLHYTIDVNTHMLGFSEARLLGVKFERVPDIKLLKKHFENDPLVQNVYLGSGDFNLLIHVIGTEPIKYDVWQYKFRLEFCHYKPRVKECALSVFDEGFMPIRNKLIKESKNINESEKKILIELILNSRLRLKDLSKRTKLSQMRVIYKVKKLQALGIIKSFTVCVQNPDKRLFIFYGGAIIPNEFHHPTLLLKVLEKIINEEDIRNTTTDYSVVCDSTGHYDFVGFCNFKDGTACLERGPEYMKKVWESEYPIIDQCILTDLIIGKWPFNSNNYVEWQKAIEKEKSNPIKYKIYELD